jgi:site-specific recombinase XerD
VAYLNEIHADQIDSYIVFRQENNMATQTINNELSALRPFLTWCIETDRITQSPMRNIKQLSRASGNKTDRRAFTEEELVKFFTTLRSRQDRGENFRRHREMIYLTMLGTGLRSNELASIKVNQVTPTHIILEAPSEKNRKGTYQPITEQLSQQL